MLEVKDLRKTFNTVTINEKEIGRASCMERV